FVERLKDEKKERREFLARESQQKIIDSLSLQISSSDFKKRGRCILLLERLKEKGKDNQVKAEINFLGSLIKKYLEEKERVYQHLKKQVEENPRLRIRQAKTERGEDVIVQLSPDEAVLTLPEWKDFVSQHEDFYRSEFDRSIERLRGLVG
ncbi:hypothetical protein H5U35_02625, partial [Candidatus Aerophobetes bacterium]|nr:hypothetical protein [Candidatus Aerophobetes bacterium]